VGDAAFLRTAARLQKRRLLFHPRPGFYVVVPPQFLNWEVPPPSWYIDALMQHERSTYYVGMLKAAELNGATHHAVMDFQVVTNRQLPKIKAGRSWITFHYRKNIEQVAVGITDRKTDTGSMKLSGPELTALDLLRYRHAAGNIDAVATALADLVQYMEAGTLVALVPHFDRSTVQRLGYLIDWLGQPERTRAMHDHLFARSKVSWVWLDTPHRRATPLKPAIVERNERWRVNISRHPELDQ
jgi:hypothetical protein